jgi:hypothetical protein
MGELTQEGVDLLAQLRPISGQTVTLEHVATQPVPQLLNGVELGSIGRQPDRLQPRQLAQCRLDVGVLVNRPIILHNIDASRRRVDLIQVAVEGADLLAAHRNSCPESPPGR